jgi:WD40 repeat protein
MDTLVRLKNNKKGLIVDQFRGHKGSSTLALFLDNDNLFTSDTDGVMIHWDITQRKIIRKYQCDKQQVLDFAISPDRKRFAAACESGNAVIIDLEKP